MSTLPNSLLPADDAARLQVLGRYQLLDAQREQILDDVGAATARLFRVSNALLTIVEGTTVLLKAPHNLPVPLERIPHAQSLCPATIRQHETAVFEDLDQKSTPGVAREAGSIVANLDQLITATMRRK